MALRVSLPGANAGRKIGMVGGTFAIAMGIGFFMQQQDAQASLQASQLTTPDALGTDEPSVEVSAAPPEIPAVPVEPTLYEIPVGPAAAALNPSTEVISKDPAPEGNLVGPEQVAKSLEQGNCEPRMSADVRSAALVLLSVEAPCDPATAFTVHHEGMMFTARTNDRGEANIIAPALREQAVFIAAFDGGSGALADVAVPEIAAFDRAVLQWRGQGAFEIHAMEFGANYGDPGHVWWDAPRSASMATSGEGGFLISLGDVRVEDARMAQVYTFPRNYVGDTGRIALSVEAEVTAANCEREIEAQTLERSAGAEIKIVDLMLQVPECEAIGDFLVLKNLLSDLTL